MLQSFASSYVQIHLLSGLMKNWFQLLWFIETNANWSVCAYIVLHPTTSPFFGKNLDIWLDTKLSKKTKKKPIEDSFEYKRNTKKFSKLKKFEFHLDPPLRFIKDPPGVNGFLRLVDQTEDDIFATGACEWQHRWIRVFPAVLSKMHNLLVSLVRSRGTIALRAPSIASVLWGLVFLNFFCEAEAFMMQCWIWYLISSTGALDAKHQLSFVGFRNSRTSQSVLKPYD